MKTEDFFIILLKTIGIYTLCNYVLNNYMIVYSITEQDWRCLISFIGFTLVYIAFIIYSRKIVKVFKLTKGIETDFISFGTLSSMKILQIVFIFLGAYLLIDNAPNILIESFASLIGKAQYRSLNGLVDVSYPSQPLLPAIIKVLIGFFIIQKSRWLSGLLLQEKG